MSSSSQTACGRAGGQGCEQERTGDDRRAMPASTSGRGADAVTIERVVAYLGKRDGIDKLLKFAKYATGLGGRSDRTGRGG